MSSDKGKNKDIINFHRLCRDLYKYIQRKVIKRYVNPEMTYAEINKHNSLNNIVDEKEWKYYNSDDISEEEKILDIFKDNVFLSQIQKCYESLEIVITSLNENQKNIEFLQKNIEVGEHKIQLLSQLNSQLNQFFNSKNENQAQLKSQNQPKNNSSSNNKTNVLERLNLVKSLNILNDLQIFNSINDQNNQDKISNKNNTNSTNTTITNNNNIILDNKIINNNIGEHKNKGNVDLVQEPLEDSHYSSDYINIKKNDWKLLNKKNKRDKMDDNEYEKISNNLAEYSKTKNSFIKNNQNFSNNKFNKIKKSYNDLNSGVNKNGQNFQKFNKNISEEDINNNIQHKISESPSPSKKSDISTDKDDNESKQINQIQIKDEKEKIEECHNSENKPTGDNILEIQFEKVLKQEFSSIYSPNKKLESNKEIIREIKIVLKKISNLKFNRANKFDDPYLIGSFSHFELNNLLDNIPAIDILFKCKDIKSFDELKSIALETMQKKLCLNYIEIAKDYDKQNEIVKMVNKCKIKNKFDNNNNNIFIFVNLFFVGINLSSYNKKENSINRFLFSNNVFDDKGKILICLFFRRWRRKFKLFFIMPEFLDIIINFYFNEKDSLSLTIENIFYDLFNGEMNFNSKKKNKICKDEDNMKDITEFINEWFKNKDYKNMLNNAIISTQESILKNDFYSTFNEEE